MPRRTSLINCGCCIEVMSNMKANSVDSIVTDPPYGLKFMGKDWDHGMPGKHFWEEAIRVAKPGAHLLAFGGTRTYHRLACAIEDAGWEIRDCIMWVYGSGFPKSHDVSKAIDKAAGATREKIKTGDPVKRMIPGADQNKSGSWIKDNGREYQPGIELPATDAAREWDGWGTALKPAWEPIIVARKPLIGTVASNVLKHGTGAINVDGCRIELNGDYKCGANGRPSQTGLGDNYDPEQANQHDDKGRFPANLIHDGSDEVVGLFPYSKDGVAHGQNASPRTNSVYQNQVGDKGSEKCGYGGSGSAARFFYCAKANKKDRGEGNNHPTVKPTDLMRYLCRMVTPPNGLVLDPFCGSGSTGKAAIMEGFRFHGIDLQSEYVEIAKQRINQVTKEMQNA